MKFLKSFYIITENIFIDMAIHHPFSCHFSNTSPLQIPILFRPQHTKKFFISGTSPNKVFVSGVKTQVCKNFLIPAFSKIGNLLIADAKYGSKCSKFSNSPKEKSSGTRLVYQMLV